MRGGGRLSVNWTDGLKDSLTDAFGRCSTKLSCQGHSSLEFLTAKAQVEPITLVKVILLLSQIFLKGL